MSIQKFLTIKICAIILLALSVLVIACKKDDKAPPTPPSDPSAVTFTNIKSNAFTVNWTAAPDVTNFLLYVATDEGFTKPVAGFNPKAVTGTSQVVDNLQKTTKYYIKLQSYKEGVKSNGVTSSVITKDVDVFVAGSEFRDNNGSPLGTAIYWKNGTAVPITGPAADTYAEGVFVSGDDVYVAGHEKVSPLLPRAVYWKNGTLVPLSNNPNGSRANSIFVAGSDVYVAGNENVNTALTRAAYWKNGTKTDLGDPANYSFAVSIFVSGTDVYVTGIERAGTNNAIARCWKNGSSIPMTITNDASALSVFVAGGDVYVAGQEFNGTYYVAKYWKNGTPVALTNGTSNATAGSIFVIGSDVYVAGAQSNASGKRVAMFWKNGVATPLSDGTNDTWGVSIFVQSNDVYIAGHEHNPIKNTPKLWKNGVLVNLPLTSGNGRAFSVFVR